jgi:hypothetical protein
MVNPEIMSPSRQDCDRAKFSGRKCSRLEWKALLITVRCCWRGFFVQEAGDGVNYLPAIFLKNDHVRALTNLDPAPIGRPG